MSQVESCRTCSDLVITDRGDSTPRPGILQVHDKCQSDQDQNDTDGEVRKLLDARDSHRTFDQHLPVRFKSQRELVFQGEMKSCRVFADVQSTQHILQDLTGSERHDGKIVA